MTPNKISDLVIDIDGALLRDSLIFEISLSSIRYDWRNIFRLLIALRKEHTFLLRQSWIHSCLDPSILSYNEEVLSYIREWSVKGGRSILISAIDEKITRIVSNHLGIFDEICIYGIDPISKQIQRESFLKNKYPHGSFAYIGKSREELPIWEHADKSITVDASKDLRCQVQSISSNIEHLSSSFRSSTKLFKAMRPHQWVKNVLIFIPTIAAHNFYYKSIVMSFYAFTSFCLIASAVYVFNDLFDIPVDRKHPRKKHRPFASGQVSISLGTKIATVLILFGIGLAYTVNYSFLGVMICYLFITTAYSLNLKRRAIIDIFVLACLYTIRIIAGGEATDISLSVWLLAFSVFIFLALAAVKRQVELVDSAKRGLLKAGGRGYHIDDLPIISMIAIGAGYVSVLVLALYLNSPSVSALYSQPQALWIVCTVLLYWITRTIMIAHRGDMHDDPLIYAVKDKGSQICFLIVFISVVVGTYA